MRITLRMYESGSCCVLDGNINVYISTEDGCNYIELYVYIYMDVCMQRNYDSRDMYVEEVEPVKILNIISAGEHAYLLQTACT